jgi:hypothetical protein
MESGLCLLYRLRCTTLVSCLNVFRASSTETVGKRDARPARFPSKPFSEPNLARTPTTARTSCRRRRDVVVSAPSLLLLLCSDGSFALSILLLLASTSRKKKKGDRYLSSKSGESACGSTYCGLRHRIGSVLIRGVSRQQALLTPPNETRAHEGSPLARDLGPTFG